ncbi:amidase [Rhodococcus zopfii]|uniref:amidase n=1 Tax=Rhodococcus zopfii TaxID=43772 RepID=UPI00365EA6DC
MIDTETTYTAAGSSTETVEKLLRRIDARDREIKAWAFLDPDLALAQARERDRTAPVSTLHGTPVGIKDIIETADQPTTYGSELWQGHRPPKDAHVISRLRQSGAVILGKTTTTEFATYRPTATRNPHHLEHSPGGSSSGSAAAVADGQVPLALGTQTAGSVLRPGAFCGVYTLKPTYGRWPFDGVLPVALTFDTVGGFARHPALLGHLDRQLRNDHTNTPLPGLPGLRIGVLRPPWANRASPAAAAMLERIVVDLRSHAAEVADVDVPDHLAAIDEAHTLIMAAEASAALTDRISRPTGTISDQLVRFLAAGRDASAGDIQNARAALREARHFVAMAHAGFDVLLTLASPGEAPRLDAGTGDPVFNKLASIAGTPAIGMPTGTGEHDLPLAIQLIGPAHSDRGLVDIASYLTDRIGIAQRCPLPEERR